MGIKPAASFMKSECSTSSRANYFIAAATHQNTCKEKLTFKVIKTEKVSDIKLT